MDEQRFTLSRGKGVPVSTEEILADIRRVAGIVGDVVKQRSYEEFGRFSVTVAIRRFGTWAKAVEVAGYSAGNIVDYSDSALFENILCLWENYGRQPRRSELARPPSLISQSPYNRRFGGWYAALEAFVLYANVSDLPPNEDRVDVIQQRGGRDPNLRQRFRVLKRDGFKCQSCGRSPATTAGVHLHVDHIVPWSNGGATIDDNLQTLCEHCNIGKSNVL